MDKFFGKKFWKIGLGVLVVTILVLPAVARAEPPTIEKLFLGGWWGDSETGLLACDGKICTDFCQILQLLNNLLFFGLTLLIYIIAPIRFIIGGVLIMTSAGEERLTKGKAMIKGTAIGLLIALGAFAIVATFLWMIGNKSASSGEPRVAWPSIHCEPGIGPFNLSYTTTTITTTPDGPIGDVPGGPYAAGTHEYNILVLKSQPNPITVVATQGGVVA
ncbi:MAG: hypothetical protein AAB787_03210, partial [Patescibacteria group bacterium]